MKPDLCTPQGLERDWERPRSVADKLCDDPHPTTTDLADAKCVVSEPLKCEFITRSECHRCPVIEFVVVGVDVRPRYVSMGSSTNFMSD